MRGQKGTLARMKRSGGGAGDIVAIRDDILLSSEIWRANADILGRVRCPPGVVGTTRGKQPHGSANPALCARQMKFFRLTI